MQTPFSFLIKIFITQFLFCLSLTGHVIPFLPLNTHQAKPALENTEEVAPPSLFLSAFILENEQTLDYFLSTLEKFDFPKEDITLQLNLCNPSDNVKKQVQKWIAKHQYAYQRVIFENSCWKFGELQKKIKEQIFAEIKDDVLKTCQKEKCDYCAILPSIVFLYPHTLSYLIEKKKPIIAPLLRTAPGRNEIQRNFMADVSDNGYFKDHPDFFLIAHRQKVGTFNVPSVNLMYVIQAPYLEQLSFQKGLRDYDFLSFSNNARAAGIDQYICNEREFGFQLNLGGMTKEEQRQFKLFGTEKEINRPLLEGLMTAYYPNDSTLKEYVKQFKFQNYQIYRVDNRDLFYVDDVNDYIKNFSLKQGMPWEEHLKGIFEKYITAGSIAIDIGAHIGTHSLTFSRLVGEKGVVYAFEPQAKIFTELVINLYLNECKNVKCHHLGLGQDEKEMAIYFPSEKWITENVSYHPFMLNEGHGTLAEISDQHKNEEKVKIVRLDDFKLENVSFIKIDVEGFENEVINGATETIKRNKPVMVVEIFSNGEREKTIQSIESLGYRHIPIYMDDFLFIPEERFKE